VIPFFVSPRFSIPSRPIDADPHSSHNRQAAHSRPAIATMYLTSQTLKTIAWSTIAFSAVRAQYVIDNLSFGHKEGQSISPNLRGIPHFNAKGDGWDIEILSDRVMLTPPYPGNKRGALWSEDPLHHSGDWTAELHFRASGMERGGGNLQLWYTKESQKNDQPASLYTAPKFDGLVLVVDQYAGRGGTVRGFLNGGDVDFKAHHALDTLSFGQCNYAYRNLGRLSVLKVQQANGKFEVTVDGNPCFSTDKVCQNAIAHNLTPSIFLNLQTGQAS